MIKYSCAYSKDSFGVSNRRSSGAESAIMTAVSTAPTMPSSENIVPTVCEASSCFRAPMYCPTITVPETVRPLTAMATRWVIWLPILTPERMAVRTAASACEKLPTTHISTAP